MAHVPKEDRHCAPASAPVDEFLDGKVERFQGQPVSAYCRV